MRPGASRPPLNRYCRNENRLYNQLCEEWSPNDLSPEAFAIIWNWAIDPNSFHQVATTPIVGPGDHDPDISTRSMLDSVFSPGLEQMLAVNLLKWPKAGRRNMSLINELGGFGGGSSPPRLRPEIIGRLKRGDRNAYEVADALRQHWLENCPTSFLSCDPSERRGGREAVALVDGQSPWGGNDLALDRASLTQLSFLSPNVA
ncbi:hypothetical protein N7471_010561 [Penicillium samsonianum]|uniref:uncharacterized protein n=1 Tax=Penicillium samsonianum TaxID=1882272 RepID=UPI00254818D1|nr:uncharacterized protein N7471_010561 [Penicillium samsonianum]KAJ6126068.1 hypothetical protein N7471_010561 [Penicillium samsonianum]